MTAPGAPPHVRRVAVVDGAVLAAGLLAIAVLAQHVLVMSALIPALVVLRMLLWVRVARPARLGPELRFLAVCTVLGATNDWLSVVHHRVYDYTVPVLFPALTTIPVWMLVFWGLILRAMASVAHALVPGPPADTVGLGRARRHHPAARIALLLLLVVATRQAIYRLYAHPVLSWLPFALALAVYAGVLGVDRARARLLAVTLAVGPAVEALTIHTSGLHRYHLGWLAGVPLWIVLWWALAILAWADLAPRLRAWLGGEPADGDRDIARFRTAPTAR